MEAGKELNLDYLVKRGEEFAKKYKDENFCLKRKAYEVTTGIRQELERELEGTKIAREELNKLVLEIINNKKYTSDEKNILFYYYDQLLALCGYV